MTMRKAVEAMVGAHGAVVYVDGARDWDGDELIEALGVDDEDPGDYVYSVGPSLGRPGIYRLIEGYMESVPIFEPRR